MTTLTRVLAIAGCAGCAVTIGPDHIASIVTIDHNAWHRISADLTAEGIAHVQRSGVRIDITEPVVHEEDL